MCHEWAHIWKGVKCEPGAFARVRESTFGKSIPFPLCVLIVPDLLLHSCFCSCRKEAGTEKLDVHSFEVPSS